jgi:metal-responsive CopG/Arc/MetJ family transcriptional regulator
MSAEKKSRRGNEPVTLRLPEEMIAAVDERRRSEPDIPTRQEMIRRILAEWMDQNATQKGPSDRDD